MQDQPVARSSRTGYEVSVVAEQVSRDDQRCTADMASMARLAEPGLRNGNKLLTVRTPQGGARNMLDDSYAQMSSR